MSLKLESELQKIGLSEKEAKVYLAGLELGPSTAQSIAAKAVVNRPTTYVMIESLIKRGLMSSFEKGKKRYFVANSPRQLLYIIDNEKRILEEKEGLLKKIIEDLVQRQVVGTKTSVRVYEGTAGIRAMQQDILDTEADFLYELTSLDEARRFIPPISELDLRTKIVSKFQIRSLYSSSLGLIEKQYDTQKNAEFRSIKDQDAMPIKGEMIVCGDKVVLSSYISQPVYIVIEDSHISATMRALFLLYWEINK